MQFPDFFRVATNYDPFPYQLRLSEADLSHCALSAPTGAGKTAAAVLAWLWQRRIRPELTPTRLIVCEPQRTLVEQVYNEIFKWLENLGLALPHRDGVAEVERSKVTLHALQGGYLDAAWELYPEQPAIIVGTQDQLLSRALNRGYAMSRYRWPVHFGFFHNDVQWVFDEVQLMGPGLVTSAQLHGLREKLGYFGKAQTLWMSATLDEEWLNTVDHEIADGRFKHYIFSEADRAHADMAVRLNANKPLSLLPVSLANTTRSETAAYIEEFAQQINEYHQPHYYTLVVVNTVDRAKALYRTLKKLRKGNEIHLIHSRFRPRDRAEALSRVLDDSSGKIVISTQVVEAGVDISSDLLFTELAPRSSLIQRFGRCNRRGLKKEPHVYWTVLSGNASAPYPEKDLETAREWLLGLDTAEPAKFLSPFQESLPIYDTLRRRDLFEIFDTSPDLGGLYIDIGRFIRDGENRDAFVFWRSWSGARPDSNGPVAAPTTDELCQVKLSDLAHLLKTRPKEIWVLDHLDKKKDGWRLARRPDLAPGRTFLLSAQVGHYSEELGWDVSVKSAVSDLSSYTAQTVRFPSFSDDARSISEEFQHYISLEAHTLNVCRALDSLIDSFSVDQLPNSYREALRSAALWHDVGKAHPVFQSTMSHGNADLQEGVLWAKRIGVAYHQRKGFRHEFASALVALTHNIEPLVTYIIASHHGKARVSIRPLPFEEEGAVLGIKSGDQMPSIAVDSLKLPECTLDLETLNLGEGSWQDRSLRLLKQLGPFRLSFLEALLRAADVRASILEKRTK